MIDFACKTIPFADVVKCSFQLNKTDFRIFSTLMRSEKWMSVSDISGVAKLDRSTVQKSVARLFEKNILLRNRTAIDGGGYLYCYAIEDKEKIKTEMLARLNHWTAKIQATIRGWN